MELLGCGHGFTELSFLIALTEITRQQRAWPIRGFIYELVRVANSFMGHQGDIEGNN